MFFCLLYNFTIDCAKVKMSILTRSEQVFLTNDNDFRINTTAVDYGPAAF